VVKTVAYDVRFGSKADIAPVKSDVRFVPLADIEAPSTDVRLYRQNGAEPALITPLI